MRKSSTATRKIVKKVPSATKKPNAKDLWKEKLLTKLIPVHKQFSSRVVTKLFRKLDSVKAALVIRSKKCDVPCTITAEELRQLTYDAYGQPCKFCGNRLAIYNMVFDHRIPITKKGPSSKDNLQIICKTCNTRKSSFDEENFITLLEWLKTMPDDFAKEVLAKLAGWHK